MKLKDWRKKKKLTQTQLAEQLVDFATRQHKQAVNLAQRTICDWENDAMPRKKWLSIIADFTKGQVKADDFVTVEASDGCGA